MNPMDRAVDEVGAALERRFAKISMSPSAPILQEFLKANGMDNDLARRTVSFFSQLLRNSNLYCHIGHAYFVGVSDEEGLRRLWDHQLRFHMDRAFRLDTVGFKEIENSWNRIFRSNQNISAGSGTSDTSSQQP
jgi:5-methylcytosine-specific restriction protein B